jgi:membrane protease YdiL (CAAX protease family)
MHPATDFERRAARRGLALYFAVLIPGSALFEWKILQAGESISKVPMLVFLLMYMPAVASVLARLALREGFSDVSFRTGARKGRTALLLAWVFPVIVGAVAYGVAWFTGLATFQRPLGPQSHLYSDSMPANFLSSLVLMATLAALMSSISAFGEELGWRGYMLTRLISAGIPQPVLASGLIWGAWHLPLILSGQYAAGSRPLVSAVIFFVGIIPASYLAAYLRLQSGSVWPAVMFHAAWNAIIQGTFDRAVAGTSDAVGESGWLTLIISALVIFFMVRRSLSGTPVRKPITVFSPSR